MPASAINVDDRSGTEAKLVVAACAIFALILAVGFLEFVFKRCCWTKSWLPEKWQRRAAQGVYVGSMMLLGVNVTVLNTSALGLSQEMGYGPLQSGLLISASNFLSPVGTLAGRFIWHRSSRWRATQLSIFFLLVTSAVASTLILRLILEHDSGASFFAQFLALRCLDGVINSIATFLATTIALVVTPKEEMMPLSMASVGFGNLGLCFGFLLSSIAPTLAFRDGSATVPLHLKVAASLGPGAILWAVAALALSVGTPSSPSAPFYSVNIDKDEEVKAGASPSLDSPTTTTTSSPTAVPSVASGETSSSNTHLHESPNLNLNHQVATPKNSAGQMEDNQDVEAPRGDSCPGTDAFQSQPKGQDNHRQVMKACIVYVLERAFTVSAVEAASSMILETAFHWDPERVGFIVGACCASSGLLMFFILLGRRLGYFKDIPVLAITGPIGALSTLLFLGANHTSPWFILVADIILTASAFSANGVTDGFANAAARQGTLYSLENYTTVKTVLLCLGRVAAPPVARALIYSCGWNAYAAMQVVITLSGACTAMKIVALMRPKEANAPKYDWCRWIRLRGRSPLKG
mmetsp:Transcript_66067/g.143335  ORF Transcript_66067/g.143335 Transcript_66067/m.143335 type:complete len:579 (-) Transcript_66067:105-1841(-)